MEQAYLLQGGSVVDAD